MTPAAELDLAAQFVALREAYDRAWDCANMASLCKTPDLADALFERCEKHLAEIAHMAAKIRVALRPAKVVDPAEDPV